MYMMELHAIVRGRVQLVMFRDFAQRKARGLVLTGYVKNLTDGSVEVVAQGERAALETFIAKLRRGSILSRVEKVDVEWCASPSRTFDGFRIIY